MGPDIIWESASRIKAWYSCPRRAKLEKFVETDAMKLGTERHALVELFYKDQKPPAGVTFSKEAEDAVLKATRAGVLPPPDQVISVEGSDMPDDYRIEAYGRTLFKMPIVPAGSSSRGWGLRGCADLLIVRPDREDTLYMLDWKGRTQDDGLIQGSVYALAYSRIYPGFTNYVFEQRSLTLSWPHDPYEFPAAEMKDTEEFVQTLVYAKTDDREHLARENQWCHTCSVQDSCPVFQKAATEPMAPDVPAARVFTLPLDLGGLLELKEKAATYEKIAECIKDRCRDEIIKTLKHGPQKHAGRTYYLGKQTNGYEVLDEGLLAEALKTVGIDPVNFLKFDVAPLRDAIKVHSQKQTTNDMVDKVAAILKDHFRAKSFDKIATKAG